MSKNVSVLCLIMKGQPVRQDVRDMIISQVRQGQTVDNVAKENQLSPNTIRRWLGQLGGGGTSSTTSTRNPRSESLTVSRLIREKQDLMAIIGELTVQNKELSKKKDRY